MSTVGRDLWMELLENDGRYSDDPLPESLWTYVRAGPKRTCFKICYTAAAEARLMRSQFIRSPRMAWSKESGINDYGKQLLADHPYERTE